MPWLAGRCGVPVAVELDRDLAQGLLLAGGADLKTVSSALGHSTISVTADVYSHVSPTMLRGAADLLERVVESGRKSAKAGD